MLEIIYRQNVEPEYPMGEPERFESLDEFLEFNYEQIDLIKDASPSMIEVEQKLRSGDYDTIDYDGVIYVTVRNIDFYGTGCV